jgi:hypothetical protein
MRTRIYAVAAVAAAIAMSVPSPVYAEAVNTPLQAYAQDIPDAVPQFTVRWKGQPVSALPVRVRVGNEASPRAYSLDIRRAEKYGTTWTALNLAGESVQALGVRDPAIAVLIARGLRVTGQPAVPAKDDLEFAARQVAIWRYTNGLAVTPESVPDPQLRARAVDIVRSAETAIRRDTKIPLQPASYGVDIFIRDTTASTVLAALVLRMDANTELTGPQNIDLYLDGQRLATRTHARTRLHHTGSGQYRADKPADTAGGTNQIAEVELDRNTKVLDVAAVWVNVQSDPGMVFVSNGEAPPIVSAEFATYSFRAASTFDPDKYTGPAQLLQKAGTAMLTRLSGLWVWAALIAGLYLLARVGRVVDAGVTRGVPALWRRAGRRRARRAKAAQIARRRSASRPAQRRRISRRHGPSAAGPRPRPPAPRS